MKNKEIEIMDLSGLREEVTNSRRYIAALEARIEGFRWLVANGERVFGTLWREASHDDVVMMMNKDHDHKAV